MTSRARRVLTALAVLLLAPGASSALEVPFLAGRVNDLAGVLSTASEDRIEQRLAQLEAAEGSQIAVLTIPSLEGEPLEDYSLRVAETWQLGRAGDDDGVLLLIARDDRKMRIEVGYGLEPILTDAYTKRILDDVLRPRFRAGDFDGGVERAVETMAALIEGNDILPPPGETSRRPRGVAPIGGFLFFAMLLAPFALSAVLTKGCSGWILYVVLMPFVVGVPSAIFGSRVGLICLAVWCLGVPLLRLIAPKTSVGRKLRSSRWGRSSGGWSSSGGGFSSGGFSGGGGSFGGGGSSGSW